MKIIYHYVAQPENNLTFLEGLGVILGIGIFWIVVFGIALFCKEFL